MAISVDWPNKIINVPKADTTLLQASPQEIRELNLNTFRLALKALEDDSDGIVFVKTHNHNPPVVIGAITLARVVEIINGYTITFEDGQYAVNLAGANTNLQDKVNVNQVSVRPNNSAGLVQSREIETAAFEGGVTIDVAAGQAGTGYPIGTPGSPVNNLADAKLIQSVRGLPRVLYVQGNLTLASGDDVTEWKIVGEGATLNTSRTIITMDAGCITTATDFSKARLEGQPGGELLVHDCIIGNLVSTHCHYEFCGMIGPMTFPAGGGFNAHMKDFHNCWSGTAEFVVDQNGSQLDPMFLGFHGKIRFINGTGAGAMVHVTLAGGTVTIDSTCTAGMYMIEGFGTVVNNGSATVNTDGLSYGGPDRTIMEEVRKLLRNKRVIDRATGIETIYDDNGSALYTRPVYHDEAGAQPYDGTQAPHRVERYT